MALLTSPRKLRDLCTSACSAAKEMKNSVSGNSCSSESTPETCFSPLPSLLPQAELTPSSSLSAPPLSPHPQASPGRSSPWLRNPPSADQRKRLMLFLSRSWTSHCQVQLEPERWQERVTLTLCLHKFSQVTQSLPAADCATGSRLCSCPKCADPARARHLPGQEALGKF